MKQIYSKRYGFASITALFLLVVMAVLGSFMLTFSNTAQLTSGQDIMGSKAYWAARAGMEWSLGNVIRQPPQTVNCEDFPETLTGFDGGFTVMVTCKRSTYTEGPKQRKMFSLTAVASNSPAVPGDVGYIERSVSARIEK